MGSVCISFRDLFASVVIVPKNWCKRSPLVILLMSRKNRLKHDLIQVYKKMNKWQRVYTLKKNDVISKRNWLKSSLPTFFTLKWTTKNYLAVRTFWACFCSSPWPREFGPTAENAAVAIPLSSPFLGFKIQDMSLKLVIVLLTFSKHCILSTVGVKLYGQPIVIFTDNILLP